MRDWSLQIPADYTVAAVTGSDVADYVRSVRGLLRGLDLRARLDDRGVRFDQGLLRVRGRD